MRGPFNSRLTSVFLKRSGVKRTVHGRVFGRISYMSTRAALFFSSEKKELFGLVAFPFFLFIEKSFHVYGRKSLVLVGEAQVYIERTTTLSNYAEQIIKNCHSSRFLFGNFYRSEDRWKGNMAFNPLYAELIIYVILEKLICPRNPQDIHA